MRENLRLYSPWAQPGNLQNSERDSGISLSPLRYVPSLAHTMQAQGLLSGEIGKQLDVEPTVSLPGSSHNRLGGAGKVSVLATDAKSVSHGARDAATSSLIDQQNEGESKEVF